jgi:3-oxoacyl-[acyl-carrier-protein] synthase-1
MMIEIIADNIISPLGISSKENYENVKAGVTGLQKYEHKFNLDFAFTASLMPEKFWEDSSSFLGLSRFEKMAVRSVQGAICEIPDGTDFDITSSRTLFILSSTKGNVELLPDVERVSLVNSAHVIAQKLGITSTPQVVCNACISGVHALLVAKRFIACDAYDYVIVCGCDVQSSFTISGFQSLKALSASPCRPFDIDRNGLNL